MENAGKAESRKLKDGSLLVGRDRCVKLVCPSLSFPHAVSGNPLLISSRFRLKDCRNDKKIWIFPEGHY